MLAIRHAAAQLRSQLAGMRFRCSPSFGCTCLHLLFCSNPREYFRIFDSVQEVLVSG